MGLRGVFFLGLFAVCCPLAIFEPFAGVVAYVTHYHVAPESTYWGRGLSAAGFRYSLTISCCLVAGTLLNLRRLPYHRLLTRQEALFLALLGQMALLSLIFPRMESFFRGQVTSHTDYVDKMVKLGIFVLALTHIVVTPRRYPQFVWSLAACAFFLGHEAYTAPRSMYEGGRLEGIGGPDFSDANSLAAHMAALLPIIGIQFLHSGWKGKLGCFVAAGFAANTIVLARSRASLLAIGAGVLATFVLVPRADRKRVWPLLLLAIVGGLTLVDAGFEERMDTLQAERREKDGSAQERLQIWRAGLELLKDHPLGVGPGNFPAHIGNYLPRIAGRDAHNTYVRCAAELGILGLATFAGLVVSAFRSLNRIRRSCAVRPEFAEHSRQALGLMVALIVYLVCAVFGSYIYTEMMWWLLLLPSALERVVANKGLELANPVPLRSRSVGVSAA